MEDVTACIQNGEFIRSVLRDKGIPFTSLQERVKGVEKLNRLGLEENLSLRESRN
jgi:hypothetical protein